jgi:hypothetical protein
MKKSLISLLILSGITFISCDNDRAIREKAAQTLPKTEFQSGSSIPGNGSLAGVQHYICPNNCKNKATVRFVEPPIYTIRLITPMMPKIRFRPLPIRQHHRLQLLSRRKMQPVFGIIPVRKVAPVVPEVPRYVLPVVELWYIIPPITIKKGALHPLFRGDKELGTVLI